MNWGPALTVISVILSAFALLWKVRRDELDDMKKYVEASMGRVLGVLENSVTILAKEVDKLREWKHDFGQKEMVYDSFDKRIDAMAERLDRVLEQRHSPHDGD